MRNGLTDDHGEYRIHDVPPGEYYVAAVYELAALVGVDAASAKVARSYFLEADGDGNIIASTPPITRKY